MRLLLFLILLTSTAYAQSSKGDQYFHQAKEALDAGDGKKALKALESARQEFLKEKNHYRYFVASQSVAIYYQDTGDGEAARQIILETISKIPSRTPEEQDIHAKLQDNLAYVHLYALNHPEEALKCYTESIRLYRAAGKTGAEELGFELVNRAVTYQSLGQFTEAARDMEDAIVIYSKDPATTPSQMTQHYLSLGSIFSEGGEYERGIAAMKKSLTLCPTDEKELEARIHNDLGIIYTRQDRFTQAFEETRKALTINEALFGKDEAHYAVNLINLGTVYKESGDLDKALSTFQEVLSIYQAKPPADDLALVDLLTNLSQVASDLGMLSESKNLLAKGRDLVIAKYGAGSLEEADLLMSEAAAAFGYGEFDLSLNLNFKALSILEEKKYSFAGDYAQIYNNIGQAYDELNDLALALTYKKKALELYSKIYGQEHANVAMAIGNIGLSYEMEGNYDEALKYLRQSLDVRLKVQPPDHDDIGTTYMNIGLILLKKNNATEAIPWLEKAKVIYDKYPKHVMKAMVYNRLAAGYEMQGKHALVTPALLQALNANALSTNATNNTFPPNPDFLSYYEIIVTYTSQVNALSNKGDKASLQSAIRLLETVDHVLLEKSARLASARDRLELAQLNGFYTEAGLKASAALFALTQDPGQLETAFYYSERSKSNELLADIESARAVSLGKVSRKLTDQEKDIDLRLNALQQQLAAAYTTGNQELMTRLKAKEFDLRKELTSVEAAIQAQTPTAAAGWKSPPSWKQVQQNLPAGTVLVSYVITDSARFVFVGSSGGLTLHPLPAKADYDKLVRGYVNQIKFQSAELDIARKQLSDMLWSPVERALASLSSVTQLIIIPDGPLNYLPFETLGSDKYVIEKYPVSYQLSAAMMLQPATAQKKKASFIALAPVFEDNATNYVNKSCERFVKEAQRASPGTRAFTPNGDYIAPLPATEKEVEAINQLHADKGVFAKYFTREDAKEELIKAGDLSSFDYIHFATHGFVNSQYPELSGLLLSQDAKSAEDGVLYSGEILGLSLQAELVTLSACETALGKKIEGEGVRGLTTAFLYAGAKSVIASLWKVADESTAELMISFYSNLLEGQSKSTALRAAKLALLKSDRYKSPYFWAPFVQIGSQ